jgi:hypothetical protein
MDTDKVVLKHVNLELRYLQPERDQRGRILKSGVLVSTEHLENELIIDLSEDLVFDEGADDFVSSGKTQINLRGTVKAFQELGTLLIALTHYQEDPEYHVHIDNIHESNEQQPKVHLILHTPNEV